MTSNSGNCASQNVVTREQFEFGQVLGEGAFGQVRLCKHKTTDVQYAAKILRKEALIKKNQVYPSNVCLLLWNFIDFLHALS